jgi:hypothetical protein
VVSRVLALQYDEGEDRVSGAVLIVSGNRVPYEDNAVVGADPCRVVSSHLISRRQPWNGSNARAIRLQQLEGDEGAGERLRDG